MGILATSFSPLLPPPSGMSMAMCSFSSPSLFYVGFLVICVVSAVSAQSFDCSSGGALNASAPRFSSLSVFPNPVRVGQMVHINTVVSLPSSYKRGTIDGLLVMTIQYRDQTISIMNIPLCTASYAIDCAAFTPGDNAINFTYLLPILPAGQYTVTLQSTFNKNASLGNACIQIVVDVQDPNADKDMYKSWISGELSGIFQFNHENYMDRSLAEQVQIGPVGSIDANTENSLPWGTFISLQGSEDLIQPDFTPAGYVWGLNGIMVRMSYNQLTREQVYNGTFQVGWVTSLSKRAMDISILNGTFTLTWFITTDANGVVHSNVSGNIFFDDVADLPLGFSNPITIGRLDKVLIMSNQEGILNMTGSKNVCMANKYCNTKGKTLSAWQIGWIVGVIGGVAIIEVMALAGCKWWRRHKREASRKAECGDVVLDGSSIQEAVEYSPKSKQHLYTTVETDHTDHTDSE